MIGYSFKMPEQPSLYRSINLNAKPSINSKPNPTHRLEWPVGNISFIYAVLSIFSVKATVVNEVGPLDRLVKTVLIKCCTLNLNRPI
jgi:hypothetical protein